jgi:hypothetical protein
VILHIGWIITPCGAGGISTTLPNGAKFGFESERSHFSNAWRTDFNPGVDFFDLYFRVVFSKHQKKNGPHKTLIDQSA